jgi:hypothetical protein
MSSPLKFGAVALVAMMMAGGLVPVSAEGRGTEWVRIDMGKPYDRYAENGLRGIDTGDCDSDGNTEVYAACYDDGCVYRFGWNGTAWNSTRIADVGNHPSQLIVGDADDDGSEEVYVYSHFWTTNPWDSQNFLYQISWNGTGWESSLIGSSGLDCQDFTMGDGDNDGRQELYCADWDGHIYEYSWTNVWNLHDVGNLTLEYGYTALMRAVRVGDIDNDSQNEVYASTSFGRIYSFEWDGGVWERADLWWTGSYYSQLSIFSMTIGDADNDGQLELYGCTADLGHVYQIRWNNATGKCIGKEMIMLALTGPAYGLEVGDADSNGENELYLAALNKEIYRIFHTPADNSWSKATIGSTANSANGLAIGSISGDTGQIEIYASAYDGHAYQFLIDAIPPPNPLLWSDTHPEPGAWYNSSRVHMLWKDPFMDISGVDGYSYCWDNSSDTVPDEVKDCEETVHDCLSAPLKDGTGWYFHIRARDNVLNWNLSARHFGPVLIDTADPGPLGLAINDGAGYTKSRFADLAISASDPAPGSGVAWMSFSNDGEKWCTWEVFCSTYTGWDLTNESLGGRDLDGNHTVQLRVRDAAGNEVAARNRTSDSIFLDRAVPVELAVSVNGGARYTNDPMVGLKMAARDPEPASGLWQMSLSNDGNLWSGWMDWAPKICWSLTEGAGGYDGDGEQRVFLRVKDRAGNVAGPASDTIFLDRKRPFGLGLVIDGGAQYTNRSDAKLTVTASDPEPSSWLSGMSLANSVKYSAEWEDFSTERSGWSLVSGAGGTDTDGEKTVYLEVCDRAGNLAGPVNGTIFLDRAAPSGLDISIDGGAAATANRQVTLALDAEDPAPASGVRFMQFSEDGTLWTGWEQFARGRMFELTAGDGQKSILFRVQDGAGNIAEPVAASIRLDTAAPGISDVNVTDINDTGATVIWTTDEESDSGVDFGTNTSYGAFSANASLSLNHTVRLSGLSASTSYQFSVASRDALGNGPARGPNIEFRTRPVPDTTPPVISDVKISNLTVDGATISWSTDEPTNGFVDFGRNASYGSTGLSDLPAMRHSIRLSGLSPGTTYHFRVRSTDLAGNPAQPAKDLVFTTAPDGSLPGTGPRPTDPTERGDLGMWAGIVALLAVWAVATFLVARRRRLAPVRPAGEEVETVEMEAAPVTWDGDEGN